jgi:hypothetical protein
MPEVKRPHVLKAVYEATSQLLSKRQAPTAHIDPKRWLYRAADLKYMTLHSDGYFPRPGANQALVVRDGKGDGNRFSGVSKVPGIQDRGAIYCAAEQSALVNEILHYTKGADGVATNTATRMPIPSFAFAQKFVVKIRLMHVLAVLDLSPHNAGSRQFLDKILANPAVENALRQGGHKPISLWLEMVHAEDASVARGIGLAAAHCGYLHGLQARTVRPSDRSEEETGDNVVIFGEHEKQIPGLWIECAYRFPLSGPPERIEVRF